MAGTVLSGLLVLTLTLSGIFMGGDLLFVLLWWFALLTVGWIFLPLTGKVFGRFFDRGYLFSKVTGIAVVSYGVWLLSSLQILSFSFTAIVVSLCAAVAVVFLLLRGGRTLTSLVENHYKVFIGEEALFLCGLIVWSFIRGLQPDIYGLEKFMDYGLVNAILRTDTMPPQDMWFAGETINYYYFGHFVCALLTRLTAIKSSITYNLMIATLFSLTFSLVFSLAGNLIYLFGKQTLKKVIAGGLLAAFLVTCGGNLHTFMYAHLLPLAKRVDLYQNEIKSYWYPDATRYIGYNPPTEDKTIHEFPCYSFVVSDLHGHVLNIPFVLTFLAVLLAYFVRPHSETGNHKKRKWWYALPGLPLFGAFMLALFYMTSPWDLPIYLTIAGVVLLCKKCARYHFDWKSLVTIVLRPLAVIFLSVVMVLPFYLRFTPFTQGIGLVHARSPVYQLMVLWGYQLFFVVCFLLLLLYERRKSYPRDEKSAPGKHVPTAFSLTAPADLFVLILSLDAVGLIVMPEIIYVKDIYLPSFHRANTMFKLTYQSFIMFGIATGYSAVRILSWGGGSLLHQFVNILLLFVLALPMLYPFQAVKGYYGRPLPNRYRGLDGLLFLERLYPGDFGAVQWLNENTRGQPVILEANGDSYTDYGRISMATGLPTVQGWFVHEWLWRGNADMVSERGHEVATVYESDDLSATKAILEKYQIQYIIIGKLERDAFKHLQEDKLMALGRKVFDRGDTKVIQLDAGSGIEHLQQTF
jgi:YYY domain-containing protein